MNSIHQSVHSLCQAVKQRLPSCNRRWKTPLARQYPVMAVTPLVHGASSWGEEYSPKVMADDIAALIDILDLGCVRVIGHSMGGITRCHRSLGTMR